MAVTARKVTKPFVGSDKPRIAPPTPAVSGMADFEATADAVDITLMPWQRTAARYISALDAAGKPLYREVAVVVGRQNGKTTLLVPLIVQRLLEGRKIMHTAQDRALPREIFDQVCDIMLDKYRGELRSKPRRANGTEQVRMRNGGSYRIVAPSRGGARGPANDLVIIDEARELIDFDFIAGAKPTLTVSKHPQMIYLSNAGWDGSVVLNALRRRAESDPTLAYLEWSAEPELAADDPKGWGQANPALGHEIGEMGSVLETLNIDYRTALLEGTLSIFETEHLCRWVSTMREKLIDETVWLACKAEILEAPVRPTMAVSMSPDGKRASAAVAWMRPDLTVGLRLLFNVTGNPIPTAEFGKELQVAAGRLGIRHIGYDPLTDAELAKYFKKPEPISGQKFANGSARFVVLAQGGHLRWADADAVTDDLTWTSRKQDRETGTYQAVRAQDDRSITASLAAIRAVWLASGPKPSTPKVM
jgi:hypothetical protein